MYGRFGQEHSHVQGADCGEGSSAPYWPVLVMQRASIVIPDFIDLRDEVAGENKKMFDLSVTNDSKLSFYPTNVPLPGYSQAASDKAPFHYPRLTLAPRHVCHIAERVEKSRGLYRHSTGRLRTQKNRTRDQ